MSFLEDHKTTITIMIIFLLLCIDSVKDNVTENFGIDQLYLTNSTKCFSCERDLARRYGPQWAWMGQNSKCFDCEKQLVNNNGVPYGALGNVSKCFDCINQVDMNQPKKVQNNKHQSEETKDLLCNCGRGLPTTDGRRKCISGNGIPTNDKLTVADYNNWT
ncbi:hypothetical protein CPAV1605_946 [seawater metagenome]|uniref:Uncharacterized protein n=1 Tax=seawater metagenome TaxID=1561972 RepID=A0A5E8CJ05_9ZZZZ